MLKAFTIPSGQKASTTMLLKISHATGLDSCRIVRDCWDSMKAT